MKTNKIKKILDMHSVPNYIIGERIFADSMQGGTQIFEKTVELTDWRKTKIYEWLGY